MGRTQSLQRPATLFVALLLTALACGFPDSEPPDSTPILTLPPETLLPKPPSTESPSPSPPITKPTAAVWSKVSGTWSGCPPAISSGLPTIVAACTQPIGPFLTLYLLPSCEVGELCGNYIKAAFDSEFIRLQLTLLEIDGSVVRMYGDAGSDMFAWASTEVEIELAGDDVLIHEAAGESYVLPPGCDAVIASNATIGCFEHVP